MVMNTSVGVLGVHRTGPEIRWSFRALLKSGGRGLFFGNFARGRGPIGLVGNAALVRATRSLRHAMKFGRRSYSAGQAGAAGVRSIGEFVVILSQAQHYCASLHVLHRTGKCAHFGRAIAPVLGVIVGCGHQTIAYIKSPARQAAATATPIDVGRLSIR